MGGRFDAVSRPGRGSEFELRLPLCREAAAGPDSSSVSEVRGTCIRIAGLPPDESEGWQPRSRMPAPASNCWLPKPPYRDRCRIGSCSARRRCVSVFSRCRRRARLCRRRRRNACGIAELPPGNLHPISAPARGISALPRHKAKPVQQSSSVPIKASGARLVGLRILAAEDNALNRLVLADILAREGGRVVFAETASS